MKKIKLDLQDLLIVLQAMEENGTSEIIFFEHEGFPALSDAEDPDSIVTFQAVDEEMANTENDQIH